MMNHPTILPAGRIAVVTTSTRSHLGAARTMLATVRVHHPEAALFIGLADAADGVAPLVGGEIVAADALGVPDLRALCLRANAMELSCTLKPFIMLHVLDRGFDTVVLLDGDIAVFAPLHAALAPLVAGADVLLTPHWLAPPHPTALPDALGILQAGVFNAGFVAVRDTPTSRAALGWWAEQVYRDCRAAPRDGVNYDQRWLDLMPSLFEGVAIARDPGLNVAYWNVARRGLVRGPAGWRVGGAPLVFFHFSGFNAKQPTLLTRYAWTPAPEQSGAIAELLSEYSALLVRHGLPVEAALPYFYERFASGTPITSAVRAMFGLHFAAASRDPFDSFEAHVNAPWPAAPRHPQGYVATNLIAHLVRTDPEIGAQIDLSTTDGVRSAVRRAVQRHAIDGAFLAAAMPGLDDVERAALLAEVGQVPETPAAIDFEQPSCTVLRSTSWRITAPLRALATLLRRLMPCRR